jgi:ArsR family transcriptional regulator, arsenate/arsenite/antimonite-responsive transcriptional repressor
MYVGLMLNATAADPALTLQRLKALGDEKRIRIVTQLASGERCVCELTEALDAGQSLLSFHLKTLKDAGLVTDRRAGRWVYYSLNGDALADLEDFLRSTRHAAASTPAAETCC